MEWEGLIISIIIMASSQPGSSSRDVDVMVVVQMKQQCVAVSPGQPVLSHSIPVTEGQDVPLHCKAENSNSRAEFFKDGSVVGNGTSSDVTIHNFSASDQGLYWCRVNGRESPRSWLLIEGKYPDLPSASWTFCVRLVQYIPVCLLTLCSS